MSRMTYTSTVEELREAFESLSRCCLSSEVDGFDPVRVVAHGGDEGGYGPEGSGLAIFENSDGRYGVLEDSEDSTGHG
jgi:hypothetical protein